MLCCDLPSLSLIDNDLIGKLKARLHVSILSIHMSAFLQDFRPGGCLTKEDGYRLEISGLGSTGVEKTKALISCAVTTQLICTFVFAFAKCRFSHDMAQMDQSLYVGTNINTYSSNTYDNITCATLYSPRMRRLNYQP